MIYIRKFTDNNKLDEYRKSNFISPHLFFDSNERKVKFLDKYEKLDYISSTKTGGQWIDLGCHLFENTDDINIEVKFCLHGNGKDNNNQAVLIGANDESSNQYQGMLLRRYVNDYQFKFKWINFDCRVNFNDVTISENNGNYSVSNSYLTKLDKICILNATTTNWTNTPTHNKSTTLFCGLNSSGSPFRYSVSDLYYLKIIKGGKVIRNLIPVKKNATNEIGLYDIENDHFYISQGDEPFIGHFNHDIYDKEILYLESSGAQYIDLDYKVWNYGLRGDIYVQRLNDSDNKHFIGRDTADGFCLGTASNGSFKLWVSGFKENTLYSNDTSSFDTDVRHVIFDINENGIIYLTVDNDEYSMSYSKKDAFKERIELFSHRQNNYMSTCRIYSCKLWDNDVMIYDLIPVRKRGVGYMYDKLTGMLFGNTLNTPLILGPDIK